MAAPPHDSSAGAIIGQDYINSKPDRTHWDLGPDLKPLGQRQRRAFILAYAWQRHNIQIIVIGIASLALIISMFTWDVLRPPIFFQNASMASSVGSSNWAEWVNRLQSFLGIGTLFVALFVWYGEIRDDWEKDLSKRMSVFFFYDDQPFIVCRYVWLAGPDDLRAWGQQVASQAAGERYLDFSPDVEAQAPCLAVTPDGTVCSHYAVRFQLTKLPSSLTKDLGMCCYQNFVAEFKDVQSVPLAEVEALSVVSVWPKAAVR
jgi:hypothetical protein